MHHDDYAENDGRIVKLRSSLELCGQSPDFSGGAVQPVRTGQRSPSGGLGRRNQKPSQQFGLHSKRFAGFSPSVRQPGNVYGHGLLQVVAQRPFSGAAVRRRNRLSSQRPVCALLVEKDGLQRRSPASPCWNQRLCRLGKHGIADPMEKKLGWHLCPMHIP